jgi:Septum formation
MKILIRVGIIAVIIVAGLLLRDRLSGNAGDLKVGDCFDVPAADTNISDVQHHPCTDAHSGEVFYVGDDPTAKGAPFAVSTLETDIGNICSPIFTSYVGAANLTGLDFGAFYPLESDWNDGKRGITCYVYKVDGTNVTKSLKAAA